MPDRRARLAEAVRGFWAARTRQYAAQGRRGSRDQGARAAVTAGKQMDGFVRVVRDLLLESGCPERAIHCAKRLELPGWFRAEKKWDLIVVHEGQLLAAAEFKSQIGPSFGNNFNNRTEESLGSASDIWAAYREGAFKPSARPWLGYLMLLEDCEASRSPVAVKEPHFGVFPEFRGASYLDRYALMTRKLLRDRLYDGACLLVSGAESGRAGGYSEPDTELGFEGFARSLLARVTTVIR